jgi:hypothetical protein
VGRDVWAVQDERSMHKVRCLDGASAAAKIDGTSQRAPGRLSLCGVAGPRGGASNHKASVQNCRRAGV